MLDDVVASLILGAVATEAASGGSNFWLRRRARKFVAGRPIKIACHLQIDPTVKPRLGRLRVRPETDDLEWWPWPRLGRQPVRLGPPAGRARVTRTHTDQVPFFLRGPAWRVNPASGHEAVLYFTPEVSKVLAPALDRGEPPADVDGV